MKSPLIPLDRVHSRSVLTRHHDSAAILLAAAPPSPWPASPQSAATSLDALEGADIQLHPGSSHDHHDAHKGNDKAADDEHDEHNEHDAAAAAGEILASNLPPVDRGKGAYSFLLAAMLTETAFFGVAFSFGTFLSFHQNEAASPFHNTPTAAITATGSVLTGLGYAMPWLLRSVLLAKPYIIRTVLLVALVVNVLSVLAASFLPDNSAWGLIWLQGIIPGVAGGTAFTPCMLWLPEWFDARRGTATGIVYLGASIGGTAFPLAFNALLAAVGFRWTLRVQAAIQLATSVVIFAFLQPRLPVGRWRRGVGGAGGRERARKRRQDGGGGQGCGHGWRVYLPGTPRVLLSPLGLCLCFLHICQTSAWAAVSLYISTLCTAIGLSDSLSNVVLAAFNASALVGLFGAGILADKIRFEALMVLSAGSCAVVAYLLLGFANSLGVVLAFVLLFGVTGSGFATAVTPAARVLSSAISTSSSSGTSAGKADTTTTSTSKNGGGGSGGGGSPADFSLVALSLILARGIGVTIGPLVASALYHAPLAGPSPSSSFGGPSPTVVLPGNASAGLGVGAALGVEKTPPTAWGAHGMRDLVLFVGSAMLGVAGMAASTAWMRARR